MKWIVFQSQVKLMSIKLHVSPFPGHFLQYNGTFVHQAGTVSRYSDLKQLKKKIDLTLVQWKKWLNGLIAVDKEQEWSGHWHLNKLTNKG